MVLNEIYGEVDSNLSTDFGKEVKKAKKHIGRRSISKMEFLIVCIGYNLKKYHRYRLREMKKGLLN